MYIWNQKHCVLRNRRKYYTFIILLLTESAELIFSLLSPLLFSQKHTSEGVLVFEAGHASTVLIKMSLEPPRRDLCAAPLDR